jgi:acyl carrier protein
MNQEEKIRLIADTLGTEETLTSSKPLKELEEWDSMGVIAVISMLDRKFKVSLDAAKISELRTVEDILKHMARE